MKNYRTLFIVLYIFLCGLHSQVFSQQQKIIPADTTLNKKSGKKNIPMGLIITAGTNHIFCDKTSVDQWTYQTNQQIVMQNHLGFAAGLTGVMDNYDLGFQVQTNPPFNILTAHIGFGILNTPRFRSFLNAEGGLFISNLNNITPPNYIPTIAQPGKELYLHYQSPCVGLALKNIFVSKPNEQGISLVTECNFQFGYAPGGNIWEYGNYGNHNTHNGNRFAGTPINSIPSLSNTYCSVTLMLGFMINESQKCPKKQRIVFF